VSNEDEIHLHTAGATVRHSSPFAHLDVPASHEDPSPVFIEKWVLPFYMPRLWTGPPAFIEAVRQVSPELNEAIATQLLSYFNWRPRIVGAYFVAIRRYQALEDQIGRLLLRSDVCFAGQGYCAALARLNSPPAINFLEQYLDYYLTRVELWFDQAFAMAALGYLDHLNQTERRARFHLPWQRFIENKPNWDLALTDDTFRKTMHTLDTAAVASA